MPAKKATKADTVPVHTSKEKIARCFVDNDGNECQVAYFDGYPFGDRMLEGVMFEATLLKDGRLQVRAAEEERDPDSYFHQLNMEKWTKDALEYAIENDIFESATDGGVDPMRQFSKD